jgi:DNA anti-recombination protein RmuC
MAQISDSGATRVEKRLSQISVGLERQREDFLSALEQRLVEAEHDIRERIQRLASTGEAERSVLEERLVELARRVDEVVQQAERRLLAVRAARD